MNNMENRWLNIGLVAVILVLAMALLAGQSQWLEGAAGILGLLGLGTCLIALILIVAALWPDFDSRARDNLASSPGKTFLIGLVNYVFLGAMALVAMNLGPVAVIGLLLAGVLLLGTFLGLPAVAGLAGARLNGMREQASSRWSEVVTGGVTLYLAALVPLVGWFILLPALCLWSFGTALLTLLSRRKAGPPEVA